MSAAIRQFDKRCQRLWKEFEKMSHPKLLIVDFAELTSVIQLEESILNNYNN